MRRRVHSGNLAVDPPDFASGALPNQVTAFVCGAWNEAIAHLTSSLAPRLWVDEAHMRTSWGEQVFDEEMKSVHELGELIHARKGSAPAAVLQGFNDSLARADRLLAVIALDEATAAGADAKKLASALSELARGDEAAAKGKTEDAIEHYREAWERAVHASTG